MPEPELTCPCCGGCDIMAGVGEFHCMKCGPFPEADNAFCHHGIVLPVLGVTDLPQGDKVMQDRHEALTAVRGSHLIYMAMASNDGPPAIVKLAKQEARQLIRSAQWPGFHIVERPDLGKRVLMLEKCLDHSACA